MARTVFQEFDQFADAINGVAGCFVPTGVAQTDWWVQVVPIGRLAIQQVQIGGASIFAGDGRDRAITLGIPASTPQRIRIDGDSLGSQSFIAVREGQPFTFAAGQKTRWAGVTIPMDDPLAQEIVNIIGPDGAFGAQSRTHALSHAPYVASLRSVVSRVCAHDGVNVPAGAASRALEEEIVLLAIRMLQASSRTRIQHIGRPRYNRDRVIARVLELLDANPGQPLFLQDLCSAARVSERTLRTIFHDYFGVGPMRLIKLRQLHEIRGALSLAESRSERVSNILERFGVSDLTVFARNYKALYGELPSHTLRRHPISSKPERATTWLRYAARRFEYCPY